MKYHPTSIVSRKDLLAVLRKLEAEFERREKYWRESVGNYSTEAMIAMADAKEAVKTVADEFENS